MKEVLAALCVKEGVTVKRSNIQKAGQGLFVTKPVKQCNFF